MEKRCLTIWQNKIIDKTYSISATNANFSFLSFDDKKIPNFQKITLISLIFKCLNICNWKKVLKKFSNKTFLFPQTTLCPILTNPCSLGNLTSFVFWFLLSYIDNVTSFVSWFLSSSVDNLTSFVSWFKTKFYRQLN